MSEIYWITRLDALNTLLIVFLFFVTDILFLSFMDYRTSANNMERYRSIRMAKRTFPAFAILSALLILLPTENQAYKIIGIGGTIDYIRQESTCNKLPKKVIDACDAYLNEILKHKTDEQ